MSAMTPEGKVKARIKEVLNKYKPDLWYFMPRGSTLGRSGIPDFVCCFRGLTIGIEAKTVLGKLSPRQMLELRSIRKAGGFVLVVNETNINTLDGVIQCLTEHERKDGEAWFNKYTQREFKLADCVGFGGIQDGEDNG